MPTEIDLYQELHNIKAFLTERMDQGVAPLREEQEKIKKALDEVFKGFKALQKERLGRVDDRGRIRVTHGPYAGFDLLDLRLMDIYWRGRLASASPGKAAERLVYIRDVRKGIVEQLDTEAILAWEDQAMRRRVSVVRGEYPARAMSGFRENLAGWTRALVSEYTRAMDSTTAGSGDELVPTLEAGELWNDVNLDTLVLPVLPQQVMPTNPFRMPTQLGDVNWYPTTENVQATTTDLSTARATLTAYGLKAGVPFSDELEEDALIALVPVIRAGLVRNNAEVIDDVLLNADTTTTNNINADGATISASTAGSAQWLLGFDGILHLPLVDNTSQSNAHAAAVTAAAYNKAQVMLGKYGVPRRAGDVVFITDLNTLAASNTITEMETVDVAGARATLSTGEIASMYGVPVIRSEQMALADANDGKVTSGGNSTSTGRILCVNTTQWRVGFRRQLEIEPYREPGKGQTTLYISFRIALTERTGTRSTATHTSCNYHVTGVT
jgi:hypothetical protein